MKNFTELTKVELLEVNGGGWAALRTGVAGVISNAITGNWAEMASSIVDVAEARVNILKNYFARK